MVQVNSSEFIPELLSSSIEIVTITKPLQIISSDTVLGSDFGSNNSRGMIFSTFLSKHLHAMI